MQRDHPLKQDHPLANGILTSATLHLNKDNPYDDPEYQDYIANQGEFSGLTRAQYEEPANRQPSYPSPSQRKTARHGRRGTKPAYDWSKRDPELWASEFADAQNSLLSSNAFNMGPLKGSADRAYTQMFGPSTLDLSGLSALGTSLLDTPAPLSNQDPLTDMSKVGPIQDSLDRTAAQSSPQSALSAETPASARSFSGEPAPGANSTSKSQTSRQEKDGLLATSRSNFKAAESIGKQAQKPPSKDLEGPFTLTPRQTDLLDYYGFLQTDSGTFIGKSHQLVSPDTPKTLSNTEDHQAIDAARSHQRGQQRSANAAHTGSGVLDSGGNLQSVSGQKANPNQTNRARNTDGTYSLDKNGDGAGDAGGTVICTELHRQGFLGDDVYQADQQFGARLEETDPLAMVGYRFLATPLVQLMRRSSLFTRLVFALAGGAWAREIAGRQGLNDLGSVRGKILLFLGLPFCRLVGRFLTFREHIAVRALNRSH